MTIVGDTKDKIEHHLDQVRELLLFIFIQATFSFCQFLGRFFFILKEGGHVCAFIWSEAHI
jgi:hypothetical protein